MFLNLFFLLVAFACVYALMSEHGVFPYILLVGFMQDPARKLIAGEPVVMTVMVGVVVACVAIRQVFWSPQKISDPFLKWNSQISAPLTFFLLIVAIQAMHSLLRYGSPFVTALGCVFYIAPLIAIMIGYAQFNKFLVARHFMLYYSGLAILVAVSVVLSYTGVDSDFFGEVGSGLVIYDQGTILKAYSGFMRSSEIASWHMGACVCFLIVLVSDRGSLAAILAASIAVVFLIAAIILTGRRKMILQIVVFSFLYFPLLRYYQGVLSVRFTVVIFSAIVLLSMFVFIFVPSLAGTDFELYFARGTSVFGDAGERFSSLGIGTVKWAIQVHGWFGAGLGVATQGAQHFVGGSVGGAGEGGLGKLVSELGVGSLLIVSWLGIVIAKHLNSCIQLISQSAPGRLPFVTGVAVFIVANVPTFVVASQVYGDLFVLLILGLLSGYLFATPRMLINQFDMQHAMHRGRAAQYI